MVSSLGSPGRNPELAARRHAEVDERQARERVIGGIEQREGAALGVDRTAGRSRRP
jgi:hypothetical protein